MKRIGQVILGLWLLNGIAHLLLMPFLEPERIGFHVVGGAAQAVIAGFLLYLLTHHASE